MEARKETKEKGEGKATKTRHTLFGHTSSDHPSITNKYPASALRPCPRGTSPARPKIALLTTAASPLPAARRTPTPRHLQ